jgi:nickel-dependent lactate racemase
MLIGKGDLNKILTETEIYDLCQEMLADPKFDQKKILAIIPDHSRTAPIDVMFKTVYQLLAERVKYLDFIIAAGTHHPLSEDAINKRVGINAENRVGKYGKSRFFNHHWNNPEQLVSVGTISESEVAELSSGLMAEEVNITINKLVFDYDILMIIGPTFPHEVVGFSGGNKYLFPGIAGQEIIDMFHWLGALITNSRIIGYKETAVRKVVDKAAAFLPMERLCLSLVVKEPGLAGLFIGTPEQAWRAAADLSEKIHIIYKEKPYQRVLSCAPTMYDDLWTGGKCMYKLEPVVADGGEIIIYAPHISEVSVTHGLIIEKIGYHVRDYFVKQMDDFRNIPGGVMAHSTHVKGIGTFEDGIETPRIDVVLATAIAEETCRRLNLGYRDPKSIDIEEWKNREDEDVLFVPKAGEWLYRLKQDPFL